MKTKIIVSKTKLDLEELIKIWEEPLEKSISNKSKNKKENKAENILSDKNAT